MLTRCFPMRADPILTDRVAGTAIPSLIVGTCSPRSRACVRRWTPRPWPGSATVPGLSRKARASSSGRAASVRRAYYNGNTGFATPAAPVTGWDRQSPRPAAAYPRARRPSGGLWSCAADLLTFSERALDPAILPETRRPRTRPDDPMTYGLGWAIGPSGQLYLNDLQRPLTGDDLAAAIDAFAR